MNYSSLKKYYEDMFTMWHEHHLVPSEIERLVPYERDIMIDLLNAKLKDESDQIRLERKQQEAIRNAQTGRR